MTVLKRITLVLLLMSGAALLVLGSVLAWQAMATDNQWVGLLSLVMLGLGVSVFGSPFYSIRRRLAN